MWVSYAQVCLSSYSRAKPNLLWVVINRFGQIWHLTLHSRQWMRTIDLYILFSFLANSTFQIRWMFLGKLQMWEALTSKLLWCFNNYSIVKVKDWHSRRLGDGFSHVQMTGKLLLLLFESDDGWGYKMYLQYASSMKHKMNN